MKQKKSQKKRKKSSDSILEWVAKWLLHKGYNLASCNGLACSISGLHGSDSIGLLIPHQENSESVENSSRRPFVGVLWFNNRKREADNKNWVLEVYREECFESLQTLAKKLWSGFHIYVEPRFVENQPKDESFLSDLDLLLKNETISEEGVV